MGKGNSSNIKTEWDRGFSVPRAFKLDHLQPIQPILFRKFSIFFTFILGSHFLLPQMANNGGITQLQNWITQMEFHAWGIRTSPFAAQSTYIVQEIFHPFHLHTGEPFFLPKRCNNGRFTQLHNWMTQMDFNAWGIQASPFAAHWTHFVPKIFHLFHLHTGEPFLITPEVH